MKKNATFCGSGGRRDDDPARARAARAAWSGPNASLTYVPDHGGPNAKLSRHHSQVVFLFSRSANETRENHQRLCTASLGAA